MSLTNAPTCALNRHLGNEAARPVFDFDAGEVRRVRVQTVTASRARRLASGSGSHIRGPLLPVRVATAGPSSPI